MIIPSDRLDVSQNEGLRNLPKEKTVPKFLPGEGRRPTHW